jgi:hypothetical protein
VASTFAATARWLAACSCAHAKEDTAAALNREREGGKQSTAHHCSSFPQFQIQQITFKFM